MSTPPGGPPPPPGEDDSGQGWGTPPPPPPGGDPWGQPPPQPPPQPGWQQPGGTPPPGYGGQQQTNGLAIGALVASILGFFCGIGFIVGLILGYSARNQIRQSQGQQGGEGLATAAIVVGWIGVALMLVGILFFIVGILGAGLNL